MLRRAEQQLGSDHFEERQQAMDALWSAGSEAEPALREMVQSGVPVMLLKGAARIALNPDEQKARVSHDTVWTTPSIVVTTRPVNPSGTSDFDRTVKVVTSRNDIEFGNRLTLLHRTADPRA